MYHCDACSWDGEDPMRKEVQVERMGELVIVERPGATNLYFVAWQGRPLGGTSRATGDHDPHCPLRNPRLAASCARLGVAHHRPTRDVAEGSDISDSPEEHTLDTDGGCQIRLTPRG